MVRSINAQFDSPLLFATTDVLVGVETLSEIAQSRYRLVIAADHSPVGDQVEGLPAAPDLLIVPISNDEEALHALLCSLRASVRGRQIPILGVADFAELEVDLAMLRAHGVVGLVDCRTTRETFVERLERLMDRSARSGRVADRVDCFLPVRLECNGTSSEEYALNVSISGMRLTSSSLLELNSDLSLVFRMPLVESREIRVAARLVRRLPQRNSAGLHEIGVFYYPLADADVDLIEREVTRLMGGGSVH
ncbi:MAG: PilZ domain-containing protein [Myxococcota bacterium]